MANFRSAPTKRKLAQLEDQTQFSSNKKIKVEYNTHTEVHYFYHNMTQGINLQNFCRAIFLFLIYLTRSFISSFHLSQTTLKDVILD